MGARLVCRFVAIAMAAVVGGGLGGAGMSAAAPTVPGELNRAALQLAMNAVVGAGAAGVQVRVHDAQGEWTGSAGVAEVGRPDGVSTDGLFRVGSITKTVTATVLLQLVGEGRLGLDDPVAVHLPQFGVDPRITVRMLLQHTSGLFNYTGEKNPDGTLEPGILGSWGKAAADSLFRDHRPDEFVRFAVGKPARFAPGSGWSYSNTNYTLVGLLIEKIAGRPYAVQVHDRIVAPLGLSGTDVPGTSTEIHGPHAHGYAAYNEGGVLESRDFTYQNLSWGNSAGEIISTTRDLDTFVTALLNGNLLAPALLAEMRKMHSISAGAGYGLGLLQLALQPGCDAIGHDGLVPGYSSGMYSTADGSRRIELSVTQGPGMVYDDPAVLQQLGTFASQVTSIALCRS